MCRLLRCWWSHELAVPHLIETCHLFTYFVAQQNQVHTCLLLQVTLESTICLAWRLSHLVFVDHLLTTHCCLTTSYIHLLFLSILFLRACTDMVVSSLLFLLQSLGELALYFASIGVTGFWMILSSPEIARRKYTFQQQTSGCQNQMHQKSPKHEFTISLSAYGTCVSVL